MGKQSSTKRRNRNNGQQHTTTAPTSTAAGWKRNKTREAVRLPSGNVALVRRTGPEAFMTQGLMPDSLAPIVQKAIHDKKGLPPKAIEKMLDTPDAIGQMAEMMDRVCVYAVIEPEVSMPPGCFICGELNTVATASVHDLPDEFGHHKFQESDRDPNVLYVDEVDLQDKVFIMNYCVGGTSDLESFRIEQSKAVGGLDAQSSLEDATG